MELGLLVQVVIGFILISALYVVLRMKGIPSDERAYWVFWSSMLLAIEIVVYQAGKAFGLPSWGILIAGLIVLVLMMFMVGLFPPIQENSTD